jgi:hypothetical protein
MVITTAVILLLVLLLAPILLIRFRKRWVAAFNLVHRPISSLWNRLAFVGLDGGEAFWGEGPDSPWWSR